jgi:hypothetical protein
MDGLIARTLLLQLREGQEVEFVATGQSMWPFVTAGSVIRVTPGRALVVGELGAFERGGRLVIHRVHRIDADAVLFRGDRHDDERVVWERVLGTARVVRRRALRLRAPRFTDVVALLSSVARRLGLAVSTRRIR